MNETLRLRDPKYRRARRTSQYELKVQRHQLESALRQARADLRVAEYQAASELGLFSTSGSTGQ